MYVTLRKRDIMQKKEPLAILNCAPWKREQDIHSVLFLKAIYSLEHIMKVLLDAKDMPEIVHRNTRPLTLKRRCRNVCVGGWSG